MRALPALTFILACVGLGPAVAAERQPLPQEAEPHTAIPAPPDAAFSSNETRLPGNRVTEIEVRTGGSRYYLQPQTPAGGARADAGRTVQWNILNFDTARPSSAAPSEEAAPVPPPPRAD